MGTFDALRDARDGGVGEKRAACFEEFVENVKIHVKRKRPVKPSLRFQRTPEVTSLIPLLGTSSVVPPRIAAILNRIDELLPRRIPSDTLDIIVAAIGRYKVIRMIRVKLILTLAVALSATTTFAQNNSLEDEKLKPFRLKCSHENKGEFVLDARNRSGRATRTVVLYEGDIPRSMRHLESTSNGPWKILATIDFAEANTPNDIATGEKVINLAENIRKRACLAYPSKRKKFERYLQRNRESTER